MYMPYQYNSAVQHEVPVPFLDFLRREFPVHGPHLFVYKHERAGTFVIAGWANRDRRRVVDLCILGSAPTLTREAVRYLRFLLHPTPGNLLSPILLARAQNASDRDANSAAQAEALELTRAKYDFWCRHVRGRGPDDSPFWDDTKHPEVI